MNNHDKIVIESIWPSSNLRPKRHFLLNLFKYPNIVNYIENRFEYIENLREGIDRLKTNIEIRPVCKYCKNKVTYRGNSIYSKYCSSKCSFIDTDKERKITSIQKYGYDNPAKNKEVQKKAVETSFRKYGINNGGWSKEAKEKIFASNQKKYGVDMPLQSNEVREKISNTIFDKYGVDKYMKSNDYKEKSKTTYIMKYGVSNPLSSKEIREKIDISKRKNHTFNASKSEETIYNLLKEKFSDIKRQYKDKEKYPFNCDFYVPIYKLYIEFQGFWTHNSHPYDLNSIKDQKILKEWKSKENKFYNCAIKTWSISDVKKRETAKKNHLHWIEFFTYDKEKIMKEIERYIEDINNGYDSIRTVL